MNAIPALQVFLPAQRWDSKKVALFCTMGGMGDKKAFGTMHELMPGAHVVGELGLDAPTLKDDEAVGARLASWIDEVKSALS